MNSGSIRSSVAILITCSSTLLASSAWAASWHTAASGGPASIISVANDIVAGSFYAVDGSNNVHWYDGSCQACQWNSISGVAASQIAVDHDGTPFVVTTAGKIKYYSGGSWNLVSLTSPPTFTAVAVGRPASDTWDAWAIGTSASDLYEIVNSTGASPYLEYITNPSSYSLVAIAVFPTLHVCNMGSDSVHEVWVLDSNGHTWQRFPPSSVYDCFSLSWTDQSDSMHTGKTASDLGVNFRLGDGSNPKNAFDWDNGTSSWSSVSHPTGVNLSHIGGNVAVSSDRVEIQ